MNNIYICIYSEKFEKFDRRLTLGTRFLDSYKLRARMNPNKFLKPCVFFIPIKEANNYNLKIQNSENHKDIFNKLKGEYNMQAIDF